MGRIDIRAECHTQSAIQIASELVGHAVACLQKSFRSAAIPVACLRLLLYVCKPRTQDHATSHTFMGDWGLVEGPAKSPLSPR